MRRLAARSTAREVVSPSPMVVQTTPDSILHAPDDYTPWQCNGRLRHATCSGVAWFHGNHLATVNVLGRTVDSYCFDASSGRLSPVQRIEGLDWLQSPENLAFTPDGGLLAITDSRVGVVHLVGVDPSTHRIASRPLARVADPIDEKAHGVAFSPCGRFLAYTTIDRPGRIRVYRLVQGGGPNELSTEPLQDLENDLFPLVPKGIDFSSDGRRVIVCHGPNVGRKRRRLGRRGHLALHAFDPRHGIERSPLAVAGWGLRPCCPDDVRFLGGDRFVVVTQQGDDRAVLLAIDPESGRIGPRVQVLERPSAPLDFPHGVGVSQDGRHLAITNYGDDSFVIHAIGAER